MADECFDLRQWAKAKRYRWRYEDGFSGGDDAPWYVEIAGKRGLIYPYGGQELLAFTTSGYAWKDLLDLGPEIKPHQVGDTERVARFPVGLLGKVAGILKPKRRRTLDPQRAREIGKATAYRAQKRLNSGRSQGEQGLG